MTLLRETQDIKRLHGNDEIDTLELTVQQAAMLDKFATSIAATGGVQTISANKMAAQAGDRNKANF